MSFDARDLRHSYDRVADAYVATYADELTRKPFDRAWLEDWAGSLPQGARVCEMGCGPGHVADFLSTHGLEVCGLDLSEEMVRRARGLFPKLTFEQGDMRNPPSEDESWDGLVSFYALIHVERERVVETLAAWWRVLRPGGSLALAFHGGQGELHSDEWFDQPVALSVSLFEEEEMTTYLGEARFTGIHIASRPPYDFEYPTQRMYAIAHKT